MKNIFCKTPIIFHESVMYKNGLIRNISLISKFMVSQPGKQTIAINILPNISRSKGKQTINFGHLLEYNMRNIFLEKSYTKCGWETSLRPFPKNQNWEYLWINSLKFYTACFFCMPRWELFKYIETKLQNTCFYIIWSFFKKSNEIWN